MPQTKEPDYAGLDYTVVPNGDEPGNRKRFGGSKNDDFNDTLVGQVEGSLSMGDAQGHQRAKLRQGAMGAMIGMGPQDEFEGVLVAQLLAAHNASMECYRRAMYSEQPSEIRREELNAATKLSRSCAMLVDAIGRHRGKGQQQIRVEHVHVNKGGQAIVGALSRRGEFPSQGKERSDGPKAIAYQPETPMRRADPPWEPVPVGTDNGEDPL
jgi:hypothetical protein